MEEIRINKFIELNEDNQIELLQELEFEDEANYKWDLFKNILDDRSISDLTRIEVLNILGASDIPKKYRENFITKILDEISKRNEDEVFLNHCIMSLQNDDLYSKKVLSNMVEIFLDFKEDEDLRMNAFAIVNNNSSRDDLILYFNKLRIDPNPNFIKNSIRWLKELDES